VAKRVFSYPVVKRNFNPSHQGASLTSAISLKLILEILLRYFDDTNGEDFQLLRHASRDSTAPLRFLATFIYRAILRRHHLCYRSVDAVKKRRLGIERNSRFGQRNAKWTRTPLERSSRWSSDLLPRFPCDLRDPPSSKWLEQVVRSEHYRLPR